MSEKRHKRPRAPVAVAAAMVSQLTSEALLGVDPRRYLDQVVPLCLGAVVHLGKLRLVPLDVAVMRLRELAGEALPPQAADDGDDDPQPETADAFLASLGRRRTA